MVLSIQTYIHYIQYTLSRYMYYNVGFICALILYITYIYLNNKTPPCFDMLYSYTDTLDLEIFQVATGESCWI